MKRNSSSLGMGSAEERFMCDTTFGEAVVVYNGAFDEMIVGPERFLIIGCLAARFESAVTQIRKPAADFMEIA